MALDEWGEGKQYFILIWFSPTIITTTTTTTPIYYYYYYLLLLLLSTTTTTPITTTTTTVSVARARWRVGPGADENGCGWAARRLLQLGAVVTRPSRPPPCSSFLHASSTPSMRTREVVAIVAAVPKLKLLEKNLASTMNAKPPSYTHPYPNLGAPRLG